MSNTNCLAGMKCPKCGSEEPFSICAEVIVKVYDDGIDDYGDAEWGHGSLCWCGKCQWTAHVDRFYVEDDDVDA